jgi:hypothetical protein
MLTGSLPYGAGLARARTRAQFRKLRYRPAQNEEREIPSWMDAALQKALHINPANRYEAISQFVFDLRKPNPAFDAPLPLMERDPLRFWQFLSLSLFAVIVALLAYIHFGTG